jgi:putative spermidine/putrescine transport system ATP-binding protein
MAEKRDDAGAADHVVSLRNVSKTYGEHVAVDVVDLDIVRGEFLTILGPSGSGKTTILRIIAGLIEPTSGEVFINGRDVVGQRPYERDISMVFQSLALFPHMTVFSNIAFPLRMRRLGREEIARRVHEALEIVRLPEIGQRSVRELSGGQRQRVALARALVYHPALLLLDEPLGALDRRLREDMQLELVRLHQEIDVTIMNVTHDQREALMLSDRIAVMNVGRIEQIGAGDELYTQPAAEFVAAFIGDAVLLTGDVIHTGGTYLSVGTTQVAVEESDAEGSATLVLRSEVLRVGGDEKALAGCDNRFHGSVELAAFEGTGTYYEVRVPALAQTVKASIPRSLQAERFAPGDSVLVGWCARDATLIPG